MSPHQLLIEPERFARACKQVSGRLGAPDLKRVGEALFARGELDRLGAHHCDAVRGSADRTDVVCFTVRGFMNPRGQTALRLEIELDLTLRCQRCLGPLRFEQAVRREIVLVRGSSPFDLEEEADEAVDIVPFVPRLNLKELIEEEVVLSLPIAPAHVGCQVAGGPRQAGEFETASFSTLTKLEQR